MKNVVLRTKLHYWNSKGYSIAIEHRTPSHHHVIFKPIQDPYRIETELRVLKARHPESYFKITPHTDIMQTGMSLIIKDFEPYY